MTFLGARREDASPGAKLGPCEAVEQVTPRAPFRGVGAILIERELRSQLPLVGAPR